MQETVALLAALLPRLARETAEPSAEGPAPGMTGRPPAAPLPGNAPAFYALTGIHATALQLEGVLLYATGKRRPGPLAARGDTDANILQALKVIGRLIEAADDDLYRLVICELEQRLNEARSVRAIDEAEQWRYVRGYACPRCGCWAVKVLLDRTNNPTRHVQCFGKDAGSGAPCRAAAAACTDGRGVPALDWGGGLVEIVPDLDGVTHG